MAVDYDLVIIGSTWAGIYAAKMAVKLQARVALVTQNETGYLDNSYLIFNQTLSNFSEYVWSERNCFWNTKSELNSSDRFSLSLVSEWTNNVIENLQAENSLANLAALGVDVILERGEFCRLPQLALVTKTRKLRSRAYLLITGTKFSLDLFPDAQDANCLNFNNIWQPEKLTSLPENLVIVGSSPQSLQLAQSLNRLDKKITLLVQEERILPQEDLEAVMLLQSQLQAEGIKIFTQSNVTQVRQIGDQKWLQAGDRALETDEIIFTDYRQLNIDGLNLAGVNVKYNRDRVMVNRRLQTTNPQIYACGDLIGGYPLSNVTQYEINLILKNIFFYLNLKTNYNYLPWAILTKPNFARVGMNEVQASQIYGDELLVVKQYFKSNFQAQITNKTQGFCKLLVHLNGEIIGCTIIGAYATELISKIAILIKHKIKIDRNPIWGLMDTSFPHTSFSFTEILQQLVVEYNYTKLHKKSKLKQLLENWLETCRYWSK